VDLAGFLARVLNKKRTFEEDFATRAATRAFTLTPREQRRVLFGVEIRADEAADLARCLPCAELDSR
jgi:hypothetical protein